MTPLGPVVGSMFTGYGGLDVGTLVALGGGRIAWCADNDPHVARLLAARLPDVPNLGDLREVDWAGIEAVDVLTAGFPCQDISSAGRRAGIVKGTRSGLFTEVIRAIRHLPRRPRLVVLENVAALRWKNGGLAHVLAHLAEAGFDAVWRSVRAADIGAAHQRERVFILGWDRTGAARTADPAGARWRQPWPGRPCLAACPGSPGEPGRCGRQRDTNAALSDCGGISLRGDPDGSAAGAARSRRVRDSDQRGPSAANPDGLGREQQHPPRAERRAVANRRRQADAHPSGERRDEGQPGSARLEGRPDAALCRATTPADPDHRRRDRRTPQPFRPPTRRTTSAGHRHPDVDWGPYAPAIARWEHLLDRPAPLPTEPGRTGRPVLSGRFVEFLMGLDDGYVSGLDLSRTAQLRILGNGVVPQQAAFALQRLLADQATLVDPECPARAA